VLGVGADNPDHAVTPHDPALFTSDFDGSFDFHFSAFIYLSRPALL
jgi:hypothetical protein